jgi:5-methylcytosine-specific restriction protein A
VPSKPKKQCSCPGCPNLTDGGKCEDHRRQANAAYEAQRGTATERGYDSNWHRVRTMKLNADPLCERCLLKGHDVAAVLVHHKDRNRRNVQWENLESLCDPCHDDEHVEERWVGRVKS